MEKYPRYEQFPLNYKEICEMETLGYRVFNFCLCTYISHLYSQESDKIGLKSGGFVVMYPLQHTFEIMYQKTTKLNVKKTYNVTQSRSELWTGSMWQALQMQQMHTCAGIFIFIYIVTVFITWFRWRILSFCCLF